MENFVMHTIMPAFLGVILIVAAVLIMSVTYLVVQEIRDRNN